MKEIKLIVDGKEVKLTEEQIKALGFEVKKNKFEKFKIGEEYFCVYSSGEVLPLFYKNDKTDKKLYLSANCCNDKELMTKRAKQEVLNRLLWRFSMENGWDDSLWEDFEVPKYRVNYYHDRKTYDVDSFFIMQTKGAVYYVSKEIAKRAIDEIIIPFEKGELEVCKIWEE